MLCQGETGIALFRNSPNDLQHGHTKRHSCNAVSFILDLLPEAFFVTINKLLKFCFHEVSQMGLTLLHVKHFEWQTQVFLPESTRSVCGTDKPCLSQDKLALDNK